MQTFLPYSSFRKTASILDGRRLGKQRVEALQALRALTRAGYGWRHHPAAKMWRGYEEALASYGIAICDEWIARGHRDSVRAQLLAHFGGSVRSQEELARVGSLPPWLGNRRLHDSHRSALVRKDPAHYRPYFRRIRDDLPYYWPVGPGG